MTPRAAAVARLALLLVAVAPSGARGVGPRLRVWPASAPPCNGMLQACVDAASPGDTVEIRSNGPIAESISFGKALTLRAGTGFQPDFAGSASIHASTSATGDQLIHIEGLTLEQGDVELTQGGAGAATLEVVNDTLAADGIQLTSTGSGPVSFFISGSTLGFGASPVAPGINVYLTVSSSGSVSGNSLSGGSAIYVENGGPTMSADLIGNRVDAPAPAGIRLVQGYTGAGTLNGRMLDNLVTDASNDAILAECDSGTLDVAIANNTTADGYGGIDLDCRCPDPGAFTAVVSNNAMTGNAQYGYANSVNCGTASDHHNLFFGNGTDSYSGNPPGPDSVFANPSYLPDHSLSPESPAIDVGDIGAAPADASADVGGSPRVAGRTVDIGAYEAAAPDVLTWPGPSCPGTLQACVDKAAEGDVVEIATASLIAESISFGKPLTLRPAAGFQPRFSGTRTIQGNYNGLGGGLIDIEGLTLESGSIQVFQLSPDPLFARVADNRIESADQDQSILVYGANQGVPHGPITVDLSGNTLTVPPATPTTAEIEIELDSDTSASGRIAYNAIEIQGSPVNAIQFGSGDVVSVDAIANHVSGTGYVCGICVFANGVTTTRILDNLVTGQAADTGAGAIELDAQGSLAAFVESNTVADDQDGITVHGQQDAAISGLAANNIASHNSGLGISIDSAFMSTFANRSNLVFANGANSFTPGPGTLTVDPLFAKPGDYHLKPASAAIDAGAGDAAPPDQRTDLDGQPRVAGIRVDLGAYEAPEVPTSLAGAVAALAIGGLASRRRIGLRNSAPSPRDRS